MPTFTFEALNEAGKPQKGSINAVSSEDAIARIRSQGLFPTSVREQKARSKKDSEAASGSTGKGAKPGGRSKQARKWTDISIQIGGISQKVLTGFTRQFSTLQDAGLPILRSLQILEQQQKQGLLKNVLQEVQEDVSGGSTLSDAMQRHPKAFDKLYTKMIAAGEIAGVLDMILQRLSEFLEKAAKLKRKIVGAMIYPAVVIGVAFTIVAGIMIFIVPKFTKIFEDFDTELPGMTLMLMNFSQWLGGGLLEGGSGLPGVILLMLLPFILYFLLKLVRKSEPGRLAIDTAVLKIPVFGKLLGKTAVARMTRTLGTLVRAGVPILDAINITRETTGNFVYQRALNAVHDSVRQGDSFAEPLRRSKTVDSIVVNMIDVGEETGDLDKMLLKIADNYDDEVDTLVESLVSLLEPIMVVVLGGIVGFIVVALFMPLVALIQGVQK
ncbi:MAG: type II secretion system F family protein [Phycisphaeraceae bacterium]